MSSSVVFDTHKFVEKLTKIKMPKEQAEALADNYVSLLNDRLSTKDDIALLKTEIGHLESRLATKDDVALLKAEIVKSQIVTIGIIIAAMAFLLQIMG